MENNDQPSKRSPRSIAGTAFCFISLLISIGFIVGSVFGIKKMDALIDHQMETFQTLAVQMKVAVEAVPGYQIAVMAVASIRGPVVKGIYSLIGLSILSFIAVIIMLRSQKVGFYIFTFANIIMCAGMIYTYLFIIFPNEVQSMQVYFLYGAVLTFLQIGIFASQLKNLK